MATHHRDTLCRLIAELFLSDYIATGTRTRDELVNSLANEIQGAIEGWFDDAVDDGQIIEGVTGDAR